jgi:murein DD-endopeptidase MepM/ murein hydrolase activator NlpD
VDPRPSDLDPYPRFGRDLAAVDLWDQSLVRSQQRRRLERASRSHRQRRKGTSLAVGAAMLAAPVVPAFASSSGRGGGSPRPKGGLDTSSVAAATGGRTQLLQFGDVGPAVTALQARVGTAADGIFGPLTRAAVERFQRSHGLPASGVVDARTWAAVFNARVLFYDDSNAAPTTAAAARRVSAERAAVRLVVDRDSGEDSPDATRPAPAPKRTTPAPTATPAPEPEPAAPVAGGCTSGRIVAPVSGATLTGHYGESRPGHTHAGDDLAVAAGTPIRAAQCGTVAQAGSEEGYGLMVCVRHAGGVTTCYAHMSRIAASVSQQVGAGQVIGYVGCTGSCTGPHVHFEVRRNGRAEDPAPYLAGTKTIDGTTTTARATSATRTSTSRTTTVSAGRSSGTTTRSVVQVAAKTTGGAPAAATTAAVPTSAPAAAATTPAPAAQPAAAPQPAPAEQPVSSPQQSAPAEQPTPAPEQSTPAPQPAPAPAPAEQPTPAPEQSAPAPQPAPTPAPAEQPTPAPEQAAPAPQPAPAPAEQPTPAPEQSAPAEQTAPAEQPQPAAPAAQPSATAPGPGTSA